MSADTIHSIDVESVVEVRSIAKREIDVRLMPWGKVIEHVRGRELFPRGAFADTVPSDVRLMGLEHEASFGLGADGNPKLIRIPIGKAISLDDREDAQYATFRVARTARGDEALELAAEGIVEGISVEFAEVPGGTRTETIDRRRTRVHNRVRLTGASPTYRPAYAEAAVLAVRTQKEPDMAEAPVPEATASAPDFSVLTGAADKMAAASERIESAITAVQTRSALPDELVEKYLSRLEALEEQARSSFQMPPAARAEGPEDHLGDWMKFVLRSLSGEVINQGEIQARVAAELITTDNLGVVPPAYVDEILGVIDPARPFLSSTRKLITPRAGMTLTVPVITTRPTVGVQAAEKDELVSTVTAIDTDTFSPVTIGGYGDISLQLLKRSDPSYLDLYVDLLAEAYAIMGDDKAVDALLAASGLNNGGTIDPDDGPQFGAAWANGSAVSRRLTPDTIWMSSQAIAQFIDAKSDTTNAPLYANIAGNFTAAGGLGGTISGLRPVHVPALDDEASDIIVGPSRGFAWAEDGSYTLQVDVPAKAGRDVGLVGMLWFAPLYPTAFTRYQLAAS